MKTKSQREQELYNNGKVDEIKAICNNRTDINEYYYVLMADYFDCLDQINDKMQLDISKIKSTINDKVTSIKEADIGGIYGVTDEGIITMNNHLSYEQKKLYFFHEFTHALQSEGKECGFYNGHTGMFLTEGATQYTAEILYNLSNDIPLTRREQPNTVRGDSRRTTNSNLNEYQYNGTIIDLLSASTGTSVEKILALAFKPDGRNRLQHIYESIDSNKGKFEEFMNNLEQIYSIDKLIIYGYGQQLDTDKPILMTMQDKETQFKGNLTIYKN